MSARDLLERQLVRIWEKVLAVPVKSVTDSFFDLGGHSLLAVKLFAEIEDLFGQRLPLATLFEAPTIEGLAAVLRRSGCDEIRSTLVPVKTSGTRVPFFFVASFDALRYLRLGRMVDADQPFYVLHPAAALTENEGHTDIESMAARYIEALRSVRPEGPYLLGGTCAGGIIAFEMAQQLVGAGDEVSLLVLVDTPQHSRPLLPGPLGKVTRRALYHAETLWKLPWGERVRYFTRKTRTLGRKVLGRGRSDGDGADAGASTGDYWAAFREAYGRILPRYVPQPYPGRIVMFLGEDSAMGILRDSRLKWRKCAEGGTEEHMVPGNHDEMLRDPHVSVLAEKLRVCLEKAHEGGNG